MTRCRPETRTQFLPSIRSFRFFLFPLLKSMQNTSTTSSQIGRADPFGPISKHLGLLQSCGLRSARIRLSIEARVVHFLTVYRSRSTLPVEPASRLSFVKCCAFERCCSLASFCMPDSVPILRVNSFCGCASRFAVIFERASKLSSRAQSTLGAVSACWIFTFLPLPRNSARIASLTLKPLRQCRLQPISTPSTSKLLHFACLRRFRPFAFLHPLKALPLVIPQTSITAASQIGISPSAFVY
jgi:hypothetical protein